MFLFITRHHHHIKTSMLVLVLVLEFLKLSATVAMAQTVGSTIYVESERAPRCRQVQVQPFGSIPSNAHSTQARCEGLSRGCTNTAEDGCIATSDDTFYYNFGDELAADEQRCPMNAATCECTGVRYTVTNGQGAPQTERIGPGEQCGGANPLSPNIITTVELSNGNVAYRTVDSVAINAGSDTFFTNATAAVAPVVTPIIQGAVNSGIDTAEAHLGEETVSNYLRDTFDPTVDLWATDPRLYLRTCSAEAIAQNGRDDCINYSTGVGLAAGLAAAAAAPAIVSAGPTLTAGSLVAVGVPFETASFIALNAGTVTAGILGSLGFYGLTANLGTTGSLLNRVTPVVDEVVIWGAQGIDEVITYGDDVIRVTNVTNEAVANCASGGVGVSTATTIYGAATQSNVDLVSETAVSLLTSNPAENIQNCVYNLNGGGN